MRNIVTSLVVGMLLALFAATGCKTLGPIVWPTTVKCLATPSAAVVERVQAIVERDGLDAAFSQETLTALDNAAREFGPDIVACVLRELIDAFTAPTGMEAPPDRLAAAKRIQNFFNEHDLEVRATGETEP
jgi:hypothetical protein